MTQEFSYEALVARNSGYVKPKTQDAIRSTRLLIAGCGIGSSLAIAAARMGFEHFVLVDGDVVDPHNLNRQFYEFADIGRPKALALRDAILRINPHARIEAVNAYLTAGNTADIVRQCDVVFDTVDFLDLPAILGLHSAAHSYRKPVFTALSVGFGALVWYFPGDGAVTLKDILATDVEAAHADGGASVSYADVFGRFVQRLAPALDTEVVEQIANVLTLMKDGKPCPASQVAVGSFAIGAMALSMMHDMLAGNSIPAAPKLLVHSFRKHQTTFVDVQGAVASVLEGETFHSTR